MTSKPAPYNRNLTIMTGEDLPKGQSILARLLVLELYHRLHRCLKVGDTVTLSGTIADMTRPRRKPGQSQPPPQIKAFCIASILELKEKPAPTTKTRQTKAGTPKPHPMWAFLEALVTAKCQVITISRTNPPNLRVVGFTNSNHQQQEAAF